MIVNTVNLGIKKIYTNSYFTFDIINSGTTDIFIYDSTVSSDNVFLNYIKYPVTIPISNMQSFNGYLKILDTNDSTGVNYVDFFTYYLSDGGSEIYDTYRYYLDYFGVMDKSYTNIQTINNIRNINNMLILFIDVYDILTEIPKVILSSIDNQEVNILPRTYKISSNKVIYLYYDNKLINRIIDNELKFIILSENKNNNILSISQRTI